MTDNPHKRPALARLTVLLSLLALLFLAAAWRFSPWLSSALYGDDLSYFADFLRGGCGTRVSDILTTVCAERFRPIASAFVISEMSLFGTQVALYGVVNGMLLAMAGLVMVATGTRLTKGRWAVALAAALAFVTGRFALYQSTQLAGPVEGLPLLFSVLSLYCYVRIDALDSRPFRWALLAVAAAACAALAHERTLMLAGWLIPAFLLSPTLRAQGARKLATLIGACIAVPLAYVGYKTTVLSAPFMVGTGGTHISLDSAMIGGHASDALLSLMGFNSGPQYLVGAAVTAAWKPAFILASIVASTWIGLLALGTISALRGARRWTDRLDAVRWPIVLLGFLTATLIPALLTIRLEQRWLMIPFAAFMLVPVWASGLFVGRARQLSGAAVVWMCLALVMLDTLIARHFPNVFMIGSRNVADAVHQDLAMLSKGSRRPIGLLAGEEHCNWTLGKGKFFEVYGRDHRDLKCFSTIEDAAAKLPVGGQVFAIDVEEGLVDLTDAASEAQAASANTSYDFLAEFANGRIDNLAPVSSPSGTGAFVMPWPSASGAKNSLTVVSGYSYTYRGIVVPSSGARLQLSAAMTYPSNTKARARIAVLSQAGVESVLFERDLVPPRADAASLDFIPISVALERFAGERVDITFSTQSPYGEPAGHWIAFASPRITEGD